MSSKLLKFPRSHIRIQRGACSEQTNKHIFHYSGIILETGQSVHITEWRIPKKILLKNCIIPTHSSEARAVECIEHTVAEISQFIENEVKSLRHIKSTIVRSYMFGDFRETKTELIFRLVQPSVNGKKLLKFTKSFVVQLTKKFLYKVCKNINIAIRDVNAYCDKTVDNWITEGSIFIDNNTDQVCVVYFGIFNSFKKILEGKYHQPTFNNDVVLGKLLNRLTTQMICAPQIRDLIQEFTTLENFKVAELMERLELDMRQPSSTNNPHGSRLVTEFENFVELGRGAFGEVYKATSILDKNIYAIKVIEYSDNTSFDKCVQEAVLLGKLNHKYIVRYMTSSKDQNTIEAIQQQIKENNGEYSQTSLIEELTMDDTNNEVDNGNYYYKNSVLADPASQEINEWEPSLVDKKYLYIQMEYCGDRNLRRALDSNRDMKKMNSYAKQLTEGLKYIHSKKIYHRDLKPENIFLTNNGKQIKIGDFGLATNPQHNYCQDSPVRSFDLLSNNVGTNDYMAPELLQYPAIQRIKYTEQVDLYSLGIILFEMFSPPFSDRHERRKSIRLLRKLPIQFGNRCLVSDNIKTLITALLAYDPDLIEQNRPEAKQVHEELIILSKSPDKRTSSEIENLSEFFDRFSSERNCKRPKLCHFIADGLDRCEASDDFGR